MRLNYSIKPLIRTDKVKQNSKYPVYLFIRIDAKQVKIPAKIDVEEAFWDKKEGRVMKGASNMVSTNACLSKLEQEFKDFMNLNQLNHKPVDIEMVKAFFHGDKPKSFYDFYEEVLKTRQLKPSTLGIYKTTLRYLKDFRSTLHFHELTPLFVKQFHSYLLTEKKVSPVGTSNRHKCIKVIIREAVINDIIPKSPYLGFQTPRTESRTMFLTLDEIRKIEEAVIPEHRSALTKIKDVFLFSCYTGIRFSDVAGLKRANIAGTSIEFIMEKTGKFISIPLIGKAKAIIEKYDEGQAVLFPCISNQKTNKGLKDVAELAGVNPNITFHVSRHSFASGLVAKDVQLNVIRDLLGHSSVKQTEVYAKNDKTGIENAMRKLEVA